MKVFNYGTHVLAIRECFNKYADFSFSPQMIHIFLLHSFMISMSNRLVKFLVKNKSCIEFFHEKIKHFKHTLKHKTFTYFIKKLVCLVFYFKILLHT